MHAHALTLHNVIHTSEKIVTFYIVCVNNAHLCVGDTFKNIQLYVSIMLADSRGSAAEESKSSRRPPRYILRAGASAATRDFALPLQNSLQ